MLVPKDSNMKCNGPVHKHLAGYTSIHKLFDSEDSLKPQNDASHGGQRYSI
jgi:hypothetical protein